MSDLHAEVLSAIQSAGDAGDAAGDDLGGMDAGAVGDSGSGGEGGAGGGDAGGAAAAAGEGTDQGSGGKPTVAEVEDKLAAELKIDPKKNNRIPYTRVQQIVANREKALLAEVVKHFGLDEKTAQALKFEGIGELFETHHKKKLGDLDGVSKQQKAYIEEMEGVRYLMEHKPEQFLANLQATYPHFKQLLTPKEQKQLEQAQAQQPARIAARPEPDIQLQDGTRTYSLEGIEKYMEWRDQQTSDRYEQKLNEVRGEYKPLIDQHKSRALASQTEQQVAQMMDGYRRNWKDFVENEAEILQVFGSDKSITIPDAYNRVVMGKMTAAQKDLETKLAKAEEETRKKVMAELKAAKPIDTGVTGTTAGMDGKEEDLKSKVLSAMRARAK